MLMNGTNPGPAWAGRRKPALVKLATTTPLKLIIKHNLTYAFLQNVTRSAGQVSINGYSSLNVITSIGKKQVDNCASSLDCPFNIIFSYRTVVRLSLPEKSYFLSGIWLSGGRYGVVKR
ncbi:hypothetical protein [Pantoea sp. AS-PWVM4]|uniref:hypothetical protein n=1 Tax=Pantoea sp. AS-PWVM4 TaxID=1332069 RepID=UPI001378823D|nr:hypothetical protein [Pantoea sp. AS-PWVM4]